MLTNSSQAQNSIKPSINHIALYVKDLTISTNFYTNIIGLDTIPEPFKDGKHVWFSIGKGLQLHIISGAEISSQNQRQTHTCFTVNSVDAFAAILVKKRIEYENAKSEKLAITIRPDGFKQLYFKDPDGYWIEISDVKE